MADPAETGDGTLLDPRWLVRPAPRRTGVMRADQPERDRIVRRWRTVSDGRDLIDPAYWNPNRLSDGDAPIPGDRMPAPLRDRAVA